MNVKAFPSGQADITKGMDLRDWFAGQAISSLPNRSWDHLPSEVSRIDVWAETAYALADAMLAARTKES